MHVTLSRRSHRQWRVFFSSAALLFSVLPCDLRAQLEEESASPEYFFERSAAFDPGLKISVEDALDEFRYRHFEAFSAENLRMMQALHRDDYALAPALIS